MQIALQNISKNFGSVQANRDITLTFNEGQIVGILGENGAGKSTLMKILSGYQPASSGTIAIDGTAVDYTGPLAAIEHGIGMLQQDPLDVGAFTVLENFVFGRKSVSFWDRLFYSQSDARTKLNEIIQKFGFELDPDMLIEELSIAQRQQLEIVRLLAQDIRTLILDEPTTGISAEQKDLLFNVLRDMAADGMTILLVSHKLEDVIALCHEVAVLRAGEIVGECEMPATKAQLVAMMFGDEIDLPQRQHKDLSISETILTLQDVSVSVGRIHIENVDLNVRQGEVIGFAGLDGSGQELLMRAIAGLESFDKGTMQLKGEQVNSTSFRGLRDRGVIFCAAGRIEEGLIAGLTLTEHVALAEGQGMFVDWRGAQTSTTSKISRYDVRGRPSDAIEQLSGGNQQRVLMSLLPEKPSLMLLEQPMRGLDVDSARGIWEKLLERCARGSALLFSSPDLDEILTYSDRIIVFYAGQTRLVDNPAQLTSTQLGHLIGGEFEYLS